MTFAKLFLVAALLLGMPFAAQVWAAEATNKDVGKFERNGSTHRLDVPNKPPVIVFGKDSEPWLETTLQSLGGKIVNTAIIANDSGESYLLVAWEYPDIIVRAPHVDFYSIYDVPAEKGYKSNRPYKVFELLRTVEAAEFGLAEILGVSGKPLGEDQPTMAVIRVYVGGNVPESTWYEYIILEGNTEKFELEWAGQISEPKDLDGDGKLEFTVGRWAKLDGCHPCWKDRQAVIGLRGGEFVPVCKTNPKPIHADIKWNKMFL